MPRRLPVISPSKVRRLQGLRLELQNHRASGRARRADRCPAQTWCRRGERSCARVRRRTPTARHRLEEARTACPAHETWLGSIARSGGGGDARTAGSPITITDLGLRNDGGLFRRRLRSFSLGKAQCRNVLILRGVSRAQNAGNIDDRANIGTVVAAVGARRGTDLRQQIGRRSRSQASQTWSGYVRRPAPIDRCFA